MLPLVFTPEYHLHLGPHVFPSEKYVRTFELLASDGELAQLQVLTPEPATEADLRLVHRDPYLRRLLDCCLTAQELMRLEIPWSPEVLRAVLLAVGGSILAGRMAIQSGVAVNLSGGFHHAFPDHGEGFCALHDVAIAIRRLQAEAQIKTAMVVDCDVHHGNGTAAIFAHDDSVFTLSLHQENNYPMPKPASDIDVNLPDGLGDDGYHEALEQALQAAFAQFQPDMVWYLAGADPYREDQLGGLALTLEGLRRRDELALRAARSRRIPVAVALAGGYARNVHDTFRIHAQTVKCALAALGNSSESRDVA